MINSYNFNLNKRESVTRKSIIPGKYFDCKKCGENFSSFTEIEKHISKDHLKIDYFCRDYNKP